MGRRIIPESAVQTIGIPASPGGIITVAALALYCGGSQILLRPAESIAFIIDTQVYEFRSGPFRSIFEVPEADAECLLMVCFPALRV